MLVSLEVPSKRTSERTRKIACTVPASEPPSGRLSNYERMESIVSSHSKEGWYMIHWLRKWHLQRTCEDQRHGPNVDGVNAQDRMDRTFKFLPEMVFQNGYSTKLLNWALYIVNCRFWIHD